MLLAQGVLTHEEYNLIGRHYGFVSPPARTLGAKALTWASVAGYGFLLAAAVAEAVAIRHPELKGPLETIRNIGEMVGNNLSP